jgi:hypothetical protein
VAIVPSTVGFAGRKVQVRLSFTRARPWACGAGSSGTPGGSCQRSRGASSTGWWSTRAAPTRGAGSNGARRRCRDRTNSASGLWRIGASSRGRGRRRAAAGGRGDSGRGCR